MTSTENPKKPVFQTMVTPSEGTIPQLTGWTPPRHAYILMEQPQLNIISDGEKVWGMGLVTINAEGNPECMHNVENSLAKKGRILHYGNFPKLNDPNPRRAEKAMLYGGKAHANPWDALERQLKVKMASDFSSQEILAAKEKEIDVLRAKLQEAQEKKNSKAGA